MTVYSKCFNLVIYTWLFWLCVDVDVDGEDDENDDVENVSYDICGNVMKAKSSEFSSSITCFCLANFHLSYSSSIRHHASLLIVITPPPPPLPSSTLRIVVYMILTSRSGDNAICLLRCSYFSNKALSAAQRYYT